jgi:hypothetical protein
MNIDTKGSKWTLDRVIEEMFKDIEEGIGIIASPSTFWLMFLFNSTGRGQGFDGYVTNPFESKVQPTPGKPEAGVPTVPTSEPTNYVSYRGWFLAFDSIGNWYIYTPNYHLASGAFSSEDAAKAYMDANNIGTPTQPTPTEPMSEVYTIVYRGYTLTFSNGLYSLSIPERHIASTFTTLLGAQKYIDNLLLTSVRP